MRIAFGEKEASSFAELVDLFPDSAFASPRRSTLPLLAYWRYPQNRLGEFTHGLGASFTSPAHLVFECEVPVRRGAGRASCTDRLLSHTSLHEARIYRMKCRVD